MIANIEKLQRKIGRMFKESVPDSPELRRIMALPRRVWETDPIEGLGTLDDLIDQLTAYTKTPEGSWRLHGLQAKVLQEAHDIGGCFGPIPVGDGKTLITYLAPRVLEAERPLLVIPAKLRSKTQREFKALREHWKAPKHIEIISYEMLSRAGGTEMLKVYNPDLLIFDEVHRLKNRQAAVTRRITQWMEAYPQTKVIALSGTVIDRSLLDYAHILHWCLPEPLIPLPHSPRELEAWAAAVDEIKPKDKRMAGGLGALVLLHPEANTPGRVMLDRSEVRQAVRDRVQQTPGVIASKGQDVHASLNIQLTLVDGYNAAVLRHAQGLLDGVKPNGDVITDEDLSTQWRVTRTLTSGFWYEWDPEPPLGWREARSAWKKIVRTILNRHSEGLESEALVARAVGAGKTDASTEATYAAWLAVRDTYKVHTKPVWEDDRVIEFCAAWAKSHTGILWVNEIALGERLEQALGLPYYHRMGLDSRGKFIEDDKAKRCIVASVSSNSEGRNLQHKWWDNLVISPMPNGKAWEQMMGRTHRPGQLADEVWFEVLIGCAVEWECWQQAMRDARAQTDLEAPKKLTYATLAEDFRCPYGSSALWPSGRG